MASKKVVVRSLELDCCGLDKPGILAGFGKILCAPEWYGENLDALFDILLDTEEKRVIDLSNWKKSALKPSERKVFEGLFSDAVEEAGREKLRIRLIEKEF